MVHWRRLAITKRIALATRSWLAEIDVGHWVNVLPKSATKTTMTMMAASAPLLMLNVLASVPDAPAAVSAPLFVVPGAPGALYSDPALGLAGAAEVEGDGVDVAWCTTKSEGAVVLLKSVARVVSGVCEGTGMTDSRPDVSAACSRTGAMLEGEDAGTVTKSTTVATFSWAKEMGASASREVNNVRKEKQYMMPSVPAVSKNERRERENNGQWDKCTQVEMKKDTIAKAHD
jgi:hypothetical protein